MKISRAVALGLALTAPAASAAPIDALNTLAQGEFKLLMQDFTAALSYKPILPAEPLGLLGFDIGLEATSTKFASSNLLDKASSGTLSNSLVVPKVHFHKGLPLNIDIGAFYSSVPTTDNKLYGYELRYAIVGGNVALPAVAIRAATSKLAGIDQLDFSTKSVDLSISKGFVFITPYVGAGRVWSTATPKGTAAAVLTEEEVSASKVFGGVNINLALLNIALETDKTGDAKSYGLKFGWRF